MSNPIVSVDEGSLRKDVVELVRKAVQDTLNALPEQEAEEMVGAPGDTNALPAARPTVAATTSASSSRPRGRSGSKCPSCAEGPSRPPSSSATAGATSVEEAISEILWGAGVSAGTVSNLNEKACKSMEEWRSRPLAGEHTYVFIDGIYLKRSWGGSYENAGILVAMGVDGDGRREAIGCAEGLTGSEDSWRGFLPWLGGPRAQGRPHGHRRQVPGYGGHARGGVPPGQVPEAHGAPLPQRLLQGTQAEAQAGRQDAEGRTRPGVEGGSVKYLSQMSSDPLCRQDLLVAS